MNARHSVRNWKESLGWIAGSFALQTAGTAGARVMCLLLNLAASIVVARSLGPSGKGMLALAMLLPAMLATLANGGLSSSGAYFIAGGRANGPVVLGVNLVGSLALSVPAAVGGIVIILTKGTQWFSGVPSGLLLTGLTLLPLTLLVTSIQPLLLGLGRIWLFNGLQLLQPALTFAFVYGALLMNPGSVSSALLANVLALLATCLVTLWTVVNAVGGLELRGAGSYLKQAARYSGQAYAGNLLSFLHLRLDQLLLGSMLAPSALGLYSVAVSLAEQLWLLSRSAALVLFPRVAKERTATPDVARSGLVLRLTLYAVTASALVLGGAASFLIRLLYSDVYLPAVPMLQTLLVGSVLAAGSQVVGNDIAARGKPIINTAANAVVVCVNLVLNLLWIPQIGALGAAWASVFSYGLGFFVLLGAYARFLGVSAFSLIVPRRSDLLVMRQVACQFVVRQR